MLLVKERSYTFSEFVDYLNFKDIKRLDKEVGKILNSSKTSKMLVTVTACLMHYAPAFADAVAASAKIAAAGRSLFQICQTAAYWCCLVMCAIEIIKALMAGDTRSISRIIAKYIIGFGALFFLPWIFDMIQDVFS